MAGSLLIVDDEASVTMTLEWFFKSKGYDVFRAFYGDQALELLEKEKPQVMILDLQMPGVDGIAVLDRVRERHAGTKVLVITGYSRQYQEELSRLKPEGVKLKPVSMEELTQAVEELFGAAPAPVPGPPSGGRVRLLFLEGSDQMWQAGLKPFFEAGARQALFEVAVAATPDSALLLLERFKPHLVVLDVSRMPIGMDAGRIAADLSKAPARPCEVIVHSLPVANSAGIAEPLARLEEAILRVARRYHLLPLVS